MSKQRVDRRIHRRSDGKIDSIEFDFIESQGSRIGKQTISYTREAYKRLANETLKKALPFDDATKVLHAFMQGSFASDTEIHEAFNALDKNRSGTINLQELAAFTPVMAPNCKPETLMTFVAKVDRNSDYKLDFSEFTNLVKKNFGREIALKHA